MKLVEYLRKTPPTSQILHLIHCTSTGRGIEVLQSGMLSPVHCSIYGEELLYLFYGRPAYKPLSGIGASGIIDLAPICLVFDPQLLSAAVRVLPFDSGAFSRYAGLIGPDIDRTAFELSGDMSMPRRLVNAFFQTNRNYFDQQPTIRETDIPLNRRSARAYARLIQDVAIGDRDDRASTIEIQFSAGIPLARALKALIAPSRMLDDADVRAALAECPGALPLPYKTYGRFEPNAFTHTIYERVDTFLEAAGCFT